MPLTFAWTKEAITSSRRGALLERSIHLQQHDRGGGPASQLFCILNIVRRQDNKNLSNSYYLVDSLKKCHTASYRCEVACDCVLVG